MLYPAIIVPAYNRAKALRRLLNSINRAKYPSKDIILILSLDGGACEEVKILAESFHFSCGIKKTILRSKNIGLREHILWCGDQTLKYGAVIVLEDDIVVDQFYYLFALEALNAYVTDFNVAGIALYSPRRNEYIKLPFEPMYNGTSTYPMQIACSWGQLWTMDQWIRFRKWYEFNNTCSIVESIEGIPDAVKKWPHSSWKKFYSAYLVVKDLYFIYPYNSYTTNCSDPGGTHIPNGTSDHQVLLPCPSNFSHYASNFIHVRSSTVAYDAFYEPVSRVLQKQIPTLLNLNFQVDFYASKPIALLTKSEFVLTTRSVSAYILRYGLIFRPIEMNLYLEICDESHLFVYLAKSNNLEDSNDSAIKLLLVKYYCNINVDKLKKFIVKEQIEKIQSSFSWKITKPIRMIENIAQNIFSKDC